MNKKLIVLSFLMVFLLVSVSAWKSDRFIENRDKQLEKGGFTRYGTYEINEHKWWDVFEIWTEEKIKEVTLEDNTDTCSDNCYAIKEISNLKPMPLIEDVRFYRDFGKGWVAWNGFTNWKVLVEEEVDVFETQCVKGKEITTKNGTYFEQECSQIKTGTQRVWNNLDMKKDYEGTYRVKLEGGKKPSTILDWQVKINGIWTTAWATWGNISDGDDAEVNLISPEDGSTALENPIVFSSIANITNGTYIVNASLYTKVSDGEWKINQTNSSFSSPYESLVLESGTLSLSGNLIYDSVYVASGATINVGSSYLNITAINNITIEGNINANYLSSSGSGNGGDGSKSSTDDTSGGGGGGHKSSGGSGGDGGSASGGSGGSAYGSDVDKLFPVGSKGGIGRSGQTTDSPGGNGGGSVYLQSENVTIRGNIYANGQDGQEPLRKANSSGGGGGSGGSIVIVSNNLNITNSHFYSIGGNGGGRYGGGREGTQYGGGGGGGSGGRIKIFYGDNLYNDSVTYSLSGGSGGTCISTCDGGDDGSNGGSGNYFIYEESYSGVVYPGSDFNQIFSNNYSSGDIILWNYEYCDSDGDCGFAVANRTVTLDDTAPIILINYGNGTFDYGSLTQNHTINYTITDTNLQTCWISYNSTNTTIPCSTGSLNTTNFALELDVYNATIYANDSVGNIGSDYFEWNYKVFENSRSFNLTSFETDREGFSVNVTTDNTGLTANFYYDGVSYSTTKIGSILNPIFTKSLDSPIVSSNENKEFYWEFSYSGDLINSTKDNQTVKDWNISFDNVHQLVNIIIRDEETDSLINSTTLGILSTNWLGGGTNNLSYSDSSEEDGIYNLGVSNSSINYLNSQMQMFYDATGYQQRNFYETYLLTNSSIQQIELYLLLADAGIINIYQVTSDYITFEEDVTISAYKIVGGSETLVDMAITDGSGSANLFLDPDFTHRLTFEKSGCTTLERTENPTGGTTTIKIDCGGDVGQEINGTVYDGLTWDILPALTTLVNGTYTFTANINKTNCSISDIDFYLTREGSVVNSTSSSESCGDTLYLSYNLPDGNITATIQLVIDEETITKNKFYTIIDTSSLTGNMTSLWYILMNLDDIDIFGLTQKSKTFIAFLGLFLILGYLGMVEGLKSENIWGVIFIMFYLGMMSYFNWLNTNLVNSGYIFSSFLNQWGILILGGAISIGILLIKSER